MVKHGFLVKMNATILHFCRSQLADELFINRTAAAAAAAAASVTAVLNICCHFAPFSDRSHSKMERFQGPTSSTAGDVQMNGVGGRGSERGEMNRWTREN